MTDGFGSSIAIDGSDVVVGAETDSEAAVDAGAVYWFHENSRGEWNEIGKILPNTTVGAHFGGHVSLSSGSLLVGASGGGGSGSVSVITAYLLGDLNGDGSNDNLDITPFVIALDAGGNEELFLSQVPDGDLAAGDIDRDGFVTNLDVTPFIRLLGQATATPSAALPEPGTLVVVIMGTLIAAPRRSLSQHRSL